MTEFRYYAGDIEDLDGLTRSEVVEMTHGEWELGGLYEETLGEIFGTVDVAGLKYDAGYALRNLDPVVFWVGCSEYFTEVNMDDYPEDEDED